MSERKIHVLPDENLGGMLREYVEVKRKAKVGDKKLLPDGTILTAVEPYNRGDGKTPGMWFQDTSGERYSYYNDDNNRLIEPTDIVHIDGQRYQMVDREAKVGERIIIVNGYGWYRDKVGYIYDVIHPSKYDFEGNDNSRAYVEYEKNAYNDVIHFVRRGHYRVLEPVEPTEIVTPEEGDDKSVLDLLANLSRRSTELEWKLTETNKPQAHPQVIDMLANLSRRIVALEKKINRLEQTDNSLHRDIETWAQEVGRLKSCAKTEFPAIKTFNLSEIKTFNLSDLDGRTLHIVVTADTEKESGLTTRVAFGRDVDSGEMFVLGCEVNKEIEIIKNYF